MSETIVLTGWWEFRWNEISEKYDDQMSYSAQRN